MKRMSIAAAPFLMAPTGLRGQTPDAARVLADMVVDGEVITETRLGKFKINPKIDATRFEPAR